MKIVHVETLIAKGPFPESPEWRKIDADMRAGIAAVHWPPNSGTFTISLMLSVQFAPYSLRRLNGGSAKTVSTESERIAGSTERQSPAKSAPCSET